jgi:predicted transcriptional regulator
VSLLPRRNDLEHQALLLIQDAGREGILQSDLWRKLGASSREGSRISLKLERRGLVKRVKQLNEGRWTYRLISSRQPTTVGSIVDVPCLICSESAKCGVGGVTNPTECEKLTAWILSLAEKDVGGRADVGKMASRTA